MGKRGIIISRLATAILSILGSTIWECATKAAVEVVSFEEPAAPANYTDRQVEIPQFNPSLGSLQSVTINLRGTGAFVQLFDHQGEGHRQLSMFEDLTLVLETSNDQILISLHQAERHFFPPSGHPHGYALEAHSSGADIDRVTAAGQKTLTDQGDLMQFTGSSFVDLFLSAESGFGGHSEEGHGIHRGLWIVGADIKVTYDYSAVPEPSTWFAGAFAMLALVFAIVLSRTRAGTKRADAYRQKQLRSQTQMHGGLQRRDAEGAEDRRA
jgi:hypothetical protein